MKITRWIGPILLASHYRRWIRSAPICLIVVMAVGSAHGGSIFDDDSTIPVKPPVAPATEPSRTSNPPNNVVTVPPAPENSAGQSSLQQDLPQDAELAHSRKLLKVAFADQLKDRTGAGRRALADVLMSEADKASYSAADRVALLTGSIDAAKEGSSLSQCLRAADMLSRAFRVDDLKMKLNAATTMTLRAPNAPDNENVLAGLELADALAGAEDFNDASRVVSLLRAVPVADADLRAVVASRSQSLELDRAAWDKAKAALETLKSSPHDQAANLAVGDYHCLRLAQWDKGLQFLAQGSDKKLRDLAAADLAGAVEATKDVQIADGWWDYAEDKATPQTDAVAIKLHAAGLYQKGRAFATGLEAKAVETRLKLAAAMESADEAPARALVYTFTDQSSLTDFDVVGNAAIRPEGGIELSHGGPSEIVTKATFRAPIRVEFEAHCMPDGVLDIAPCVLTEGNADNTGFGIVLGGNFNRESIALVFGAHVQLRHTPLKANQIHRIVISIDKHGNAEGDVDGKMVYKASAPKDTKLAGHIIIGGGRGDVVYTRVVIHASKATPQS